MTTLLLQLAGPMQSWGTGSRFAFRSTGTAPSKSAVIGLLASAQGRRRSESIEDLLGLRFGVRSDQPGRVIRDFQTARALDESYGLPLTYRFYLSDAVFVAGVEGETDLIEAVHLALRRPAFPLFLGRRSCPPARPLVLGVTEKPLVEALETLPWQAAAWYRRKQPARVRLELVVDAMADDAAHDTIQDAPVSFDPHHRRYGLRRVQHLECEVANPDYRHRTDAAGADAAVRRGSSESSTRRPSRAQTSHDPMSMWEGQ